VATGRLGREQETLLLQGCIEQTEAWHDSEAAPPYARDCARSSCTIKYLLPLSLAAVPLSLWLHGAAAGSNLAL